MSKQHFIELAPKLVADAFAEADSQAIDGASFVQEQNGIYTGIINKVGKTIFNTADYSNPLHFMYSEVMEDGAVVEMVASQVEAWINDTTTHPASITRDELKQYPAKVIAAYAALQADITAPVTIHDKAIKQAFTRGTGEQFYTTKLTEMKNAIDRARFMSAKELLNRVITDSGTVENNVEIAIDAIESKDDALKVWAAINAVIGEFKVNTSKYNQAGYYGQVANYDANGESNLVLIGRATDLQNLQTYAADIFHKDNLNQAGIELVYTDNFGGITSSVDADYDAGDGSQIEDMSAATFTDPHEDVRFLLCERKTFVATTNWDDVETRRDVGSRATTFMPQSQHNFAHLPWKPFATFEFVGKD